MASDVKLQDEEVVLQGSETSLDSGLNDSYSVALNFKNNKGYWHLSGPRDETGNPFSVYWRDRGITWMGPYLKINTNGNVGIGIGENNPGFKLEVGGRMRVRQAGSSTAGIWFHQAKPASDRAFVGMLDDNHIGFYGSSGADWGLTMDTTSGNIGIKTNTPARPLHVEGNEIHCGGGLGGFSFGDRNVSQFVDVPAQGERWVWYAANKKARLWSGKDLLTVSADGKVSVKGGFDSNGKVSMTGGFEVLVPSKFPQIPGGGFPKPGGGGVPPSKPAFISAIKVSEETGNVGIGKSDPSDKFALDVSGDVQVSGNLNAAKINNQSSKTLKENISELSAQEALAALTGLNPVKFRFKADAAKESHVGFIAEDVPELVAAPDRRTLSAMDIVAVLTKVVQEQSRQISELTDELKNLKKSPSLA